MDRPRRPPAPLNGRATAAHRPRDTANRSQRSRPEARGGCAFILAALLWSAPGPASGTSTNTPPESAMNRLTSLSLEELAQVKVATVEGASRYEQKVTRAPASVTLVTREDIQRFGYRNIADILGGVRGFYTTSDRNYTYLGVRGFNRPGDYNGRLLTLVDHHRLNDSIYDSVLAGNEEVLDVDLLERVEIIRGPSSSIYGNNAFFGVVNMLTRTGADFDGWETSLEGGSHDTYKGRLTYGRRFTNNLDLVLSGSAFQSRGDEDLFYEEFEDPSTNDGRAINSDEESSYKLFSRLGWGDVTLTGLYSRREKNVPTASYETLFNDGHESTIDSRGYVDIRYQRDLTPDSALLARVYYDYYGYHGDYPYNLAAPGDPPFRVINRDKVLGQWAGAEAQWTRALFDRHTVVVGAEYRELFDQDQVNYDASPREYHLRDRRDNRNVGVYAQAEATLRTNLLLNAGVRYDHYSTFGDTVNPRAGLIWSPWSPAAFKLLYGTAYRAPNVFESRYESAEDSKSNPDLDPETIRTYELVYEHYLPDLPGDQRVSTSLYYYEIDDLITQTVDPADGLSFFDNLDKAKAKGIELEWDGRYDWGFRTRLSYALQHAEDDRTGQELSNSPRHLAKFHLVLPLYPDKLFAGIEVLYQGRVKSVARNTVDDFFLTNLTLFSGDLAPGLTLSASLYNLFDERYAYPGTVNHVQDSIQQDGRSFRVKLTYTF